MALFLALSSLVALSVSGDDKCNAPTTMPDPVSNMTLIHIQFLTRHGERTPLSNPIDLSNSDSWICDDGNSAASRIESAPSTQYRYYLRSLDGSMADFHSNCQMGDLTTKGMQQHLNLGSSVRQYLVTNLSFLPAKYVPRYFTIVSSPIERSFRSAESLMDGLYPPLSSNEVITIESGTEYLQTIYPDSKSCHELEELYKNFSSSTAYQTFLDNNWPILSSLADLMGYSKSFSSMDKICDWSVAYWCGSSRPPSMINSTIVDVCRKVAGFNQIGQYEFSPDVAFSATMRHMLKVADQAISGATETKFALFSGHDSSISALLALLGYHSDYAPSYASAAIMELWKSTSNEIYIRFSYNGTPLTIGAFGAQVVKFDEFRSVYGPRIQHCPNISP